MPQIDWRAVRFGAGAGLALALPSGLVGAVVVSDDANNGVFIFYALIMAGMLVAGFVAGSKRPEAPLTHGAVASVVAYAIAQSMTLVVLVLDGSHLKSPAVYAFNVVAAAAIGAVGGLIAERRNARVGSTG